MFRKFLVLLVAASQVNSCCSDDFVIPDNDYFKYALDVNDLINECSDLEQFTTVGATADGEAGSCWSTQPLHSRWFKFTSTSTGEISIDLLVGGEYGTQRRSLLALWESDGVTELDCSTYEIWAQDDASLYLYYGNLDTNTDYYFSVDVADSQSVGTFSFCLSDTD